MTITPVKLRAAYNAEFNRMQRFGEIRPGIYHRRAATIRAAIYVLLPDEPILCKGTELEMARQDERYRMRLRFFKLVHALESWREHADA